MPSILQNADDHPTAQYFIYIAPARVWVIWVIVSYNKSLCFGQNEWLQTLLLKEFSNYFFIMVFAMVQPS